MRVAQRLALISAGNRHEWYSPRPRSHRAGFAVHADDGNHIAASQKAIAEHRAT